MSKNDSGLAWVLTAIGFAGAGFAAGLHRLVWSLFWILTVLWITLSYLLARSSGGDEEIYWLFGIGAPIVVAAVLAIVEGVVLAILGNEQK